MIRAMLSIVIGVLLVGCIPADVPPQVAQPLVDGVSIQVDAKRVIAPSFTVDYPDGWRIIKSSEAVQPVTLVFASEGDALILAVSEEPLSAFFPDDKLYQRDAIVDDTLYLWGESAMSDRPALDAAFTALEANLHITSP